MDQQHLRKAGLKITAPRLRIMRLFDAAAEAQRHLSADEIYRQLLETGDDVGLATVYRVLTQFEEAGIIRRHNFEGGFAVYELDQGSHHDHLVCVKCGKVTEFVDPLIESRQQDIAQNFHFKMTDHALNIYGVCAGCEC